MPAVTVLSDWKSTNSYFGKLTGILYSSGYKFDLVELTKVAHHNVMEAAYILQSCIPAFPKGTIHLVFVGMTSDPCQISIGEINGQFIITWNGTGLLSLLDGMNNLRLFHIDSEQLQWISGIGQCCIQLMENKNINEWTFATTDQNVFKFIEPVIQRNMILGNVIQIDPYGNAITNIKRKLFDEISKGREFEIYLQSNFNKITTLSRHYEPNKMGELLALFNEDDFLEIAISHGNLAELLSIDSTSEVRVKFIQNKEMSFLK